MEKIGRCILIGAGDLTVGEIKMAKDDFCIAVDGGLDYCEFLQVEPDLIIGDFDSVTEEQNKALQKIEAKWPEKVIRLKPEKDDTDMIFALKHAMSMGYREFRLYAAMGGRFDHALANVQSLLFLKNHGAVGYLMDGNGMTMVIKNETVKFRADVEGTLSLLALSQKAEGVTIRGMKYDLEKAVITNDYPIGVSNEFMGREAEITVENGELVCAISYAC